MSGVLIDNWNLQEAIKDMLYMPDDYFSQAYSDLLMAIVLWDEVYFPDNSMANSWEKYNIDLSKYIKSVKDNGAYEEKSQKIYNALKTCGKELEWPYEEFQPFKFEKKIIATGAIRYSLYSDEKGWSYLPSFKRAQFLNNNSKVLASNIAYDLNRKDSLAMYEKIVKEQIDELTHYYPEGKINLSFPVLDDYIRYNAGDHSSYFEVAFQMKSDKAVRNYRKYMDSFEESIRNGKMIKAVRLKKDVQDLVNDVLKLTENKGFTASGTVLPIPSLNVEKNISVERIKFQLNFLRKLTRYTFEKL